MFLKLAGRSVLLVGGGSVATAKARALADAGADVRVVSPTISPELSSLIGQRGWTAAARTFRADDLDGAWLVISAAPADVNRVVAHAADARRIFVVAVDDPATASAYGGSVLRRDGVTVALSTDGHAPALTGLLREGLDAVLPADLGAWLNEARRLRPLWRAEGVPMDQRRPRLLSALNGLYAARDARNGDRNGDTDRDVAGAKVQR